MGAIMKPISPKFSRVSSAIVALAFLGATNLCAPQFALALGPQAAPTASPTPAAISSLSISRDDTACAVKQGALYCWGGMYPKGSVAKLKFLSKGVTAVNLLYRSILTVVQDGVTKVVYLRDDGRVQAVIPMGTEVNGKNVPLGASYLGKNWMIVNNGQLYQLKEPFWFISWPAKKMETPPGVVVYSSEGNCIRTNKGIYCMERWIPRPGDGMPQPPYKKVLGTSQTASDLQGNCIVDNGKVKCWGYSAGNATAPLSFDPDFIQKNCTLRSSSSQDLCIRLKVPLGGTLPAQEIELLPEDGKYYLARTDYPIGLVLSPEQVAPFEGRVTLDRGSYGYCALKDNRDVLIWGGSPIMGSGATARERRNLSLRPGDLTYRTPEPTNIFACDGYFFCAANSNSVWCANRGSPEFTRIKFEEAVEL